MNKRIKPGTQQEFVSIAETLMLKYNNNEKLNPYELEFFCTALHHRNRGDYPICTEYHFRDLYFRRLFHHKAPAGLELNELQIKELEQMADDWHNNIVLVANHSNQTHQFVAKETRNEIKLLSREFVINGELVKSDLYYAKLRRLLWMSRFIHFKIVYDFFLGFKSFEIWIPSIYGNIVFNDFSLAHILTRHYAAGEKQYFPDQSFFSQDIQINSLPKLIRLVLGRIAQHNINIVRPISKAISFKYKAEYYQLYIDHAFIQRKGHKGNLSVLRVESIFPVNKGDIIEGIEQQIAHKVSKHLIIFEQSL